ncbi:unnamed protein product [Adineta ricciae]|uniref:Uncharacterized protein n=1 Tax=Adineta ricciae TaxID=249248 RepID=A0A814YA08_ADIRI|nr:unnamed protein product [Adineta ricciae]CAF1227528.1 unnamed protein product [Adineta ricciae]
MESLSRSSSEIEQSSIHITPSNAGYSTPPRAATYDRRTSASPCLSQLFHQPKLLTSAELKRRFPPIHIANRKRRYHLIRKTDCLVPLERNLNVPEILPDLFDSQTCELSPTYPSIHDDCMVPLSSSMASPSLSSFKIVHPRPNFNYLIANCFKTEQENSFSISETMMKQKFKFLLQKN